MITRINKDIGRHQILDLMIHPQGKYRDRTELRNLVGVELGVARGGFSKQMLDTGCFKKYVGVDSYTGDRGHDVNEYMLALCNCDWLMSDVYNILRMTFAEASCLFPAHSLHFVYFDGYAYRGPGASDLRNWWEKILPGGLLAGDDFDEERYPDVVYQVEEFADRHSGVVYTTNAKLNKNVRYSRNASWAIRKQ